MNIAVHKNLYRYHVVAAHHALLKKDVVAFEQHYLKANASLYSENDLYFHYIAGEKPINKMYEYAIKGFNVSQKTVEKAAHYISDFLYVNYKKQNQELCWEELKNENKI